MPLYVRPWFTPLGFHATLHSLQHRDIQTWAKIRPKMAKKIDKNRLKLASNRQNQQISLNIFKIYLAPEIWVFIPFLCHCFPNFRKLRDFFENVERFSVKTRLNLPAAYSVYVFLFSLMLIQYEDHQNYRIEFAENSYFSSIS